MNKADLERKREEEDPEDPDFDPTGHLSEDSKEKYEEIISLIDGHMNYLEEKIESIKNGEVTPDE